MPTTTRILTRKPAPDGDRCVCVEDGRPCAAPAKTRGVCVRHLSFLRAHRRLEALALPRKTGQDLKHQFSVKPAPEPGLCRLIVNGTACARVGARRGLCVRHYQSLWQREDLDVAAFALPPNYRAPIRLRRAPVKGLCRAHEAAADCPEPAHARGLCQRHYKWLGEHAPALFAQIATPDRKAVRYSLRERLRDGGCRVAENDRGCGERAERRGLCVHHEAVLRRRPELLDAIALPARAAAPTRFERRPPSGEAATTCVVLENDVPCPSAPTHRGVCHAHRKRIGGHADYALADFYDPAPVPALERKAPEETADGLCQVIEDGRPCATPPTVRGLCRHHYRAAAARDALGRLAGPVRERRAPHGAGNDRPHFYLDKNVLFDHAEARVFGADARNGSAALVEHVIAGRARASVSADAIKSTYNHVRYRLQRPAAEGGRALDADVAEALARDHVARTFYAAGAWRVVVLDAPAFAAAVRAPAGPLSLEDGLEFAAYRQARAGMAGPTAFVTRDTDFPEGVHPSNVARAYGW